MAAALQTIPAGAKHVGGNVYQLPRRRSGGGAHHGKHGKKGAKKAYKHSFWSKQWVWYALALALADVLGEIVFTEVAPWVSVPALFLWAYGEWKNKPGAKNAAYALQGAHMLAYWGVSGGLKQMIQSGKGGGLFGIFKNTSADAGGGGGGGVKLDSHTIGNAIKNATGVAQVAGEVAAFV